MKDRVTVFTVSFRNGETVHPVQVVRAVKAQSGAPSLLWNKGPLKGSPKRTVGRGPGLPSLAALLDSAAAVTAYAAAHPGRRWFPAFELADAAGASPKGQALSSALKLSGWLRKARTHAGRCVKGWVTPLAPPTPLPLQPERLP